MNSGLDANDPVVVAAFRAAPRLIGVSWVLLTARSPRK
jgi:hypothetical protein